LNNLMIVCGHYGSGKTEFCVNFALGSSERTNTVLIDMDIVNPYFRSREQAKMLTNHGVRVVGGATGLNNLSADMPALPAEIYGHIDNRFDTVILDVGGDANGARVLARYADKISARPYDMLIVVNGNRPATRTAGQVASYIESINTQSRLCINGIINNTHMLRETTLEDILRGEKLAKEVGELTGLPLIFNVAPASLKNTVDDSIIEKLYTIQTYMRPQWL